MISTSTWQEAAPVTAKAVAMLKRDSASDYRNSGSLPRDAVLFFQLLDRALADACIAFVVRGENWLVGNREAPRVATLDVRDPSLFTDCLLRGSLGLGEAYMAHGFEVLDGSLAAMLEALLRNKVHRALRHDYKFLLDVLQVRIRNGLRSATGNVRFHYDLGPDLFASFLDPTMTYSCGYAQAPDDSLADLQRNKLDRICRKLRLQPGVRVLDIGCGFAGLLIYAAKNYGIHGVGITLSKDQFEVGKARIAEAGLSDELRLEIRDQAVPWPRSFDRVVSVGMLEHLPRSEYTRYFRNIAGALKPGGFGLVHAIGCTTDRNRHDPFIQKYIFPRSAQPRLSEVAAQLERNGLVPLDVENMVRHYALTCARWLENFRDNGEALSPQKYDHKFRRMWEFYLSGGIATARASDQAALYQVLFTNDPAANLPLARV